VSSYYPGEPEPTVPFDRRPVPPAPGSSPVPYPQAYGAQPYETQPYDGQPQYPAQQGYPVAPPPAYRPAEPVPYYGYPVDPRQQAYQNALYSAQKSRIAAGLLALFLGCLGIHNFYLGRTGIGVLQLLLTVLSVGFLAPGVAVWVLIEAILIFSRSPSFATDRRGIPLRD
jgi:hypothetical protein